MSSEDQEHKKETADAVIEEESVAEMKEAEPTKAEVGRAAERENEEFKEPEVSLAQDRRKVSELATNLQYLQADFENYRKRTDRRMREVEEKATSQLVTRLLRVLDELELATATAEAGGEIGVLLDGVKMVYKTLLSELESEGLQRIESVGKQFDPSLHEAVERVGGGGKGDALVVEEIRPGYLFRSRVIRPSMVKVKLGSPTPPKTEAKTNE
jgi:molecular chaperone GrpE